MSEVIKVKDEVIKFDSWKAEPDKMYCAETSTGKYGVVSTADGFIELWSEVSWMERLVLKVLWWRKGGPRHD